MVARDSDQVVIGIPAGRESSGAGTRTPNDWTKTSRVANYTTPER